MLGKHISFIAHQAIDSDIEYFRLDPFRLLVRLGLRAAGLLQGSVSSLDFSFVPILPGEQGKKCIFPVFILCSRCSIPSVERKDRA
jgi:hypothetical protein